MKRGGESFPTPRPLVGEDAPHGFRRKRQQVDTVLGDQSVGHYCPSADFYW